LSVLLHKAFVKSYFWGFIFGTNTQPNSKHEFLNPKQIQMTKNQNSKQITTIYDNEKSQQKGLQVLRLQPFSLTKSIVYLLRFLSNNHPKPSSKSVPGSGTSAIKGIDASKSQNK